ncbi:MAG: hypothetical protein N2646_01240 [Bellilinea sp.]|nr:hypothetical protein [Bellilinea sp.]
MLNRDIFDQIKQELDRAEQARKKGNEGMARVCARRAAGFAALAILQKLGRDIHNINGLDALHLFSKNAEFPTSIRRSAEFLTMRVTPDHLLPLEVDLLQQARQFINELNQWMEDQID